MLVLTRKVEQKIRIGKDIVITILRVQGEQVSVGIDAPKHLQIVREELLPEYEDMANLAAQRNRKSVFHKDTNPNPLLEEKTKQKISE